MENPHRVSDHLEPWSHLHGKVVMVTGASSGLGRELCLDLAKAGCRIVASARRIDRLQSVCDQINQLSITAPSSPSSVADNGPGGGPRAVAVELDVSADGSAIEKSVNKAWDAFGLIDALVNNAGIRVHELNNDDTRLLNGTTVPSIVYNIIMYPLPLTSTGSAGNVSSPLELSEEEWNNVFRTNLTGSWLVSKFVAIRMRDADQGGSIVNISSITGLNRGFAPGATAYNCSKAGVNTLTKTMAMELGVHKIRVNAISLGLFRSEITERLMQKDWLHNVAMKIVPLRTFGTSDPALTSLVRYLVHDSSEYVSGNIYIVDAGTSLPGVPIFSSL
ncbi:hypothetical protein FF2_019880 [Malus domestica]